MKIIEANYPDGPVKMCINASFSEISAMHDPGKIVIITDEHVFSLHEKKFRGYPLIKIKSGEAHKTQSTADGIIEEMLGLNIDKSYLLIAVGGGVVTDIAGYVASVYKRGIKLGLVPTTILGMTDAAIGGKNGINVGMYKNMVGTTYRPQFILYDWSFLETLPEEEFINGFAEIIKHACIKDAMMFEELSKHDIAYYRQNKTALASLIEKNIAIKTDVVIRDEQETGERYILNFGHSFGHAIENLNQIPHGHAISIGMVIAAKISEERTGFPETDTTKLIKLLQQYHLPVSVKTDRQQVMELLVKDKKSLGNTIQFVLLNDIGLAVVRCISFEELQNLSKKIMP